jgi:hypothetical protein
LLEFPYRHQPGEGALSHKIALLVIHGIGSQKPGYSDGFRKEMTKRLVKTHGLPESDFTWGEVFWADILTAREEKFFRDMDDQNPVDWLWLRKFLLTTFADAAAYSRVPGDPSSTYFQIHARIKQTLAALDTGDAPLLIPFAHSLGGHIITNYIYDVRKWTAIKARHAGMTKAKRASALAALRPSDRKALNVVSRGAESDFMRLKTLAGIVTFGCNIPLFTFALDNPQPVDFRGEDLTPAQKKAARWLNYYDRDDVLGYPLKPINPAYEKGVSEDIEINVGGPFTSWNPLSHDHYWTDNSFTKRAAAYVAAMAGVAGKTL